MTQKRALNQKDKIGLGLCLILVLVFSLRGVLAVEGQGKWLFIGDSHSVRGFGDGVRETLFERGLASDAEFFQYSISGSTAANWVDGSFRLLSVNWAKKVPGKLKEVTQGRVDSSIHPFPWINHELKPAYLIVALGTNDSGGFARGVKALESEKRDTPLEREKLLEQALAPMKLILEENRDARCVLVLPPKLKAKHIPEILHQQYTDALKKIGEKRGCLVVDSRLILNSPPGGFEVKRWKDCLISEKSGKLSVSLHPDQTDGIHFLKKKGEYWGRCVALLMIEAWGSSGGGSPE